MVAPKSKILLIEDDPDQVLMYSLVLQNAGYDVLTGSDEKEVLELSKKEKPKLIFLDLLLGKGTDGINILRSLKKNNQTKNLKVVVLTNFNKKGLKEECLKLGAIDFLNKDRLVPSDLVIKLEKYLLL